MSNPALRDHGKLPGGESRRKSSLVSEPGRSEKRQRRQNSTSKGPEVKVQEEVKEFKGFGSTPGPPGGQGGDTGRSRKQEQGWDQDGTAGMLTFAFYPEDGGKSMTFQELKQRSGLIKFHFRKITGVAMQKWTEEGRAGADMGNAKAAAGIQRGEDGGWYSDGHRKWGEPGWAEVGLAGPGDWAGENEGRGCHGDVLLESGARQRGPGKSSR